MEQTRGKHVYYLSLNMDIVRRWMAVGTEMKTVDHFMVSVCLCIHPCAQCAFMHGVVFVLVRICICV